MKHLVLVGAGHAHLQLLSTLAARPAAGAQLTLVTPHPQVFHAAMLAGFVAGQYSADDCRIALAPLLAGTGVTWLQRSVTALDANTRRVTLDDGSCLNYDLLGIDTGRVQERAQIEAVLPGARAHALFVRPLEGFAALWPQVLVFAARRAPRVCVIGAGTVGVELALSLAWRLKGASITLLTGGAAPAASETAAVQARLLRALKMRHITVLRERAVGITASEVLLASGAQLACDVPVLTVGAQAPAWLQGSGLALDATGRVQVDVMQRANSHRQVFAAFDVATQPQPLAAGVDPDVLRAGSILATNLRAALAGIEPAPGTLPTKTLKLLACGEQAAIAGWRNRAVQGRWVGWLKDRIDRRFVKRYQRVSP